MKAPANLVGNLEFITPEIAKAYLGTSVGNRKLRRSRVSTYAKDAKEGRWKITHQGIAFDEDGHLTDGHHRLTMVAESGVAVWLFVVRGVPKEAYSQIDGNLARSLPDSLKSTGVQGVTNRHVSIASMMLLAPHGTERHLSREVLIEALDVHHDAIAFAASGKSRGITRGVRALLARAYYHIDIVRLNQFSRVIHDGQVENPQEDNAAVIYRNWLLKIVGQTSASLELERYMKGQYCLRAFVTHQVVTKALVLTDDIYPLPNMEQTA